MLALVVQVATIATIAQQEQQQQQQQNNKTTKRTSSTTTTTTATTTLWLAQKLKIAFLFFNLFVVPFSHILFLHVLPSRKVENAKNTWYRKCLKIGSLADPKNTRFVGCRLDSKNGLKMVGYAMRSIWLLVLPENAKTMAAENHTTKKRFIYGLTCFACLSSWRKQKKQKTTRFPFFGAN